MKIQSESCKLIIHSLSDANAECACGNWFYTGTGPATRRELKSEHKRHVDFVQFAKAQAKKTYRGKATLYLSL